MALFLVAFALLLATSGLAALALRLCWPGTLLAAYVLASAGVVLAVEGLSLVHAVRPWPLLALEAMAFAGAAVIWHARGRPRPRLPRVSPRRHPLLAVLGAAVALALAYEAWLVVATPPNNWDSLTYHLTRVAAWYQRGAVEWHPALAERENVLPPNAEIETLYTVVFLGRDTLAALPQLLAQLALVVAVFGIARRVGFARPAAAFAALLTPTLAQVALQATTTQTDLVAAALVASCAYFLLGGEALLAGAALGLALGAKPTAFLAVPLLVLLAVLTRRRLAPLAATALAGFALFGAYGYVANLSHTGHLLGATPELTAYAPEVTARGTVSTVARTLWRFVDLSGWDASVEVRVALQETGIAVFDALGIDWGPPEATSRPFHPMPNTVASEDISYFGPLGLLVLALALFGLRRRSTLALAAAVPVFVVELALVYRWNEWLGRYLLIPVALALPLAAALYRWRVVSSLAAAAGVLFLVLVLVRNEAKPPFERPSRAEAFAVATPTLRGAVEASDRIPGGARVGVALAGAEWPLYPLYGERLDRRLVFLKHKAPFRAAERAGLDWLVLDRYEAPAGWRLVSEPGASWAVATRA